VGATDAGASLIVPGVVKPGGGGLVILGDAGPESKVGDLAALLRAAGFDAAVTADIQPHLWRKLVVSAAINPVSSLLGVPNGALLDDSEALQVMRAAALEVVAVAAAEGVDLGPDAAELPEAVAQATASNHSSMLQDLDRGRPTEIDAISGFVAERAMALGLAAPVNAWLWRQVQRLEVELVAEPLAHALALASPPSLPRPSTG
jgi:2-dehydropantoate 2-reductase